MYTGCGYIRKSIVRRGHEHETVSADKQRDAIEKRAAEIGSDGLTIFIDFGGHRSGRTTENRPDWIRLKQYLVSSECRFLVVFQIDRSARSVREIAELVDLCQQYNKRLVTCWDGVDTDRTGFTANAIADINFRAVLAQYHSDQTSDLMKQTSALFREKLHIPWGMWPFGFTRTGKGKDARLVPADPHAATVRTILTWYAGGLSYDAVAQRANEQGLRHLDRDHMPKRFTRETIRAVVGNVLFYAGFVIIQRWKAKDARIELDPLPGSHLERYARHMKAERSSAIEPIITPELASQVIERRHRNQYTGRKPVGWVALLTPIAYCENRKLRAGSYSYGNYYHPRGSGAWINGEAVDAELVSRMSAITFPFEMRQQIRQMVSDRIGYQARLDTQARIKKLEAQMERLLDLHLDGNIERSVYDSRYIPLEKALAEARQELLREDDVDRLMSMLTDLGAAIELMTAPNRKRALHRIFTRVDLAADGGITRLTLAQWAREAFGEIIFYHAKGAPGEISSSGWHGIEWLIQRIA